MPHLPFLAIVFFPIGMLRQVGILLVMLMMLSSLIQG
jgi:hypothetical protein